MKDQNRVEIAICEQISRNIDALMRDNENEEQFRAFHEHLQTCEECAAGLKSRREMRKRLQNASNTVEPPPYLAARIRANLRTDGSEQSRRAARLPMRWAIAGTLAAGVVLAAVIADPVNNPRLKPIWQDAYIRSVSFRVSNLMRAGLGDHIHCSVFRKFPKDAPSAAALTEKIGPEYAGLVPIVRKHVPEEYRMVIAHRCKHRGREFVHLSLKSDTRLLSLVIASKQPGETFDETTLIPELAHSGIPMYQSGASDYEISAFESGQHAVFLISDLPREANSRMMLAMAPEVKTFLQSRSL